MYPEFKVSKCWSYKNLIYYDKINKNDKPMCGVYFIIS